MKSILEQLRSYYYNVKWLFKNLYSFRKILWTYRTWDHGYALDLYIKGLEDIYDTKLNDKWHVVTKSDLRKVKTALVALKEYSKESYEDDDLNDYKYRTDTFFNVPKELRFVKFNFDSKVDERGLFSSVLIDGRSAFLKENNLEEKYRIKSLEELKLQQKRKQELLKLAHRIIEKHSHKWWT